MNTATSALIPKIASALNGKPMLGGSILLDFSPDGRIAIGADNKVTEAPDGDPSYDCVLTLSLATLVRLQTKQQSIGSAWFWRDLRLDGDRALAEKFGELVKNVK